ncbi:hypothetical protein Ahy_B07g088778 [Arachis hypogaea]|uniref:Ubiquitin-like protease family profile domain-containing protein n=1 Tax=Arachis hypogaea TaxID=3818 RepID=A0A444YFH0_ARAHY|nr:hypothetical protein Ahy_B07g088778 [Arachis hypogaea]
MTIILFCIQQTKDLKCATHLLSEKFRNMSEEKKTIVRDLGFGGLMHIPPLRVHHQVLRELAKNFKLGENRLETGYSSFKIIPKIIGDALGINASGDLFPQKVNYKDLSEDDKEIFRRFQGKTLKNLTDEMMDIGVGNEQDRLIMESKKRKKNQEDSDSESESTDEIQSKKKKVVVEDLSPEQTQSYHGSEIGSEDLDELLREKTMKILLHRGDLRSTEGHYVSSETIPDVNLGSDDPSSQGHTEQSSVNKPEESMVYFRLSLVEESASEPADSNVMVVREETPSEGLAIVPIQVCLPLSQTTTVPKFKETPETEYEPTPLLQIEETTKSNPAPEDAAALMMMARTASYVPKTDLMPSFSLSFTDSSQKESTTQEGASTQDEHRAKTPETPKLLEQLEDLKCYHWAIRVKTYADGLTDEFDNVCKLQAQDRYTLSKLHLASPAPKTHIEAEIVTAMCFILNQQNIQMFQEEVYCLPPNIMNMALANHPDGVFLQPKNNKPFRVEDYPMFIPFLDLQKLKSHRYIFAPVCHSHHWWLWFADTRNRKFYIVDSLHKKSPSDARTALNTFVYMLGELLKSKDKDREIVAPYLHISGQKTSYDCAIYVMKWLEIFEPANIKRRKYEWDDWTQDEVDHFRVEYASRILFHDMNLDKDEAISGSNAIRLSRPSSLLLSPYCQIDSEDVDTA